MSKRYLAIEQLSEKLGGRSVSALNRDIAAGRLPAPIVLGRRRYWMEDAVDEHLASQST